MTDKVLICVSTLLAVACSERAIEQARPSDDGQTVLVRAQAARKLIGLDEYVISYPFACSDGTIVFSRVRTDWSDKWTLWEIPAHGGEAKSLIREELPSDATRSVCSPDSRHVVFRLGPNRKGGFDTPGQVRVLDRRTGEIRTLTDGSKGSDFYSVWGPQSEWLVVQRFSFDKDDEDADLWRVWLDGPEEPLIDWPSWESPGGISPDGSRILFVSYHESDEELRMWEVDLLSPEKSPTLVSSEQVFFPMWSPDGQWISFASDRDGYRAVYLQSSDGATVIQVSEPVANFAHPTWSADGNRLITEWQEPDDKYSHLIVALDVSAVIEEFSQTD